MELLTGLLLGTLLGFSGFFFTLVVYGYRPLLSSVIGVSILGICIRASGVGALVPQDGPPVWI